MRHLLFLMQSALELLALAAFILTIVAYLS